MNNNKPLVRLRLSHLAHFVVAQMAMMSGTTMTAQARDYFNPALLELGTPGQKAVDLTTFENKGSQLPGTYRVDLFINNERMDTRNVEFRLGKDDKGNETLQPCIPVDDLASWGVLIKKFSDLGAPGNDCANLAAIPQASSDFRFARQQLLLSFPQSAVNNSARGWVDPKSWDEGIPAALLNYSVTGSNNNAKSGHGNDSSSQYINLRPGINIGPWRLRNYTTWTRSSTEGPNRQTTDKWDTVYTYAQRDIIALKSQLTAGDTTTAANVFDSIPFRGAQLASDDDMLPESLRGYAPIVRGIARSNAQVTIRQNGYVIYQAYVSPGSFEITDMFPTGGSGDLNVTIKESDGSEQLLVIPFASLPVLQREGRLKYSATTGVYRSYDNSVDKTPLSEGSLIYGLPAGFTIYGGGQFASKYQSLAAGVGKNLGDFGALSVDVTQAWSKQKDQQKESGQSWRVRYSKNFVTTGSNFSVAGDRYATDGYWGMQEVLDTYTSGDSYSLQERRRNRAELTLSQDLWPGGGNLGITAAREDYWNTDRRMESYGVSYNNSWDGISYGVNYTYNRNSQASYGTAVSGKSGRTYDEEQLLAANVSVPLSKLFGDRSTSHTNYMANSSKNGNTTHSVSVSGTALEDNNLNWSVQEGYGTKGQGNSGSVNADWRATYGEVNGGYAYDNDSQRLNYGVQGGLLAHENGVTFGQPLGETVVLVAAPDAKSVAVQGQTGVKTDFRGYAVVPYASPYRKNDVTLNTESFADNTEVAITTQTVVPTRGAVVRARYQTSVGNRVLMTLLYQGGKLVPFGSIVSVSGSKDAESFIVGDAGQVYLTGLAQSGQLKAQWGSSADEQCRVNYSLSQNMNGIATINGQCI
ncbi:fimbrial biogenesis outer membrane usher protein [Lelliottia amnigena]|uniref:fimbria/pilus outer membrane usher protein n=1 Tax=Lelliottia TaxID=1330545 RepID=UPI00192B531F|nr:MULTISPECIES: fimbria/pilus outer membrane usher protein [Lelliottia]MBL5885723.1 fimbrial biogenesis outer membrane usher protein [Lelliottia aquatilis]MBL5923302.1 fimbrial biogenesis outer membrane usher protein [Lelliottia amnigena]MBL5932211.1 fimbrial biogenesis outer membrane usher protein [Lelliottia amnigena]